MPRKMLRTPKQLTQRELRLLRKHSARWERLLKPQRDAIRESERITGEDLAIRINARPEDR